MLCDAQDTLTPAVDPATVLVFTADHGVKTADGALSPFPSSVSQAVFRALAAGISGTAVLADSVGAHLTVVDVGIDGDVSGVRAASGRRIAVTHAKVARGTADCRRGPAMTEEQLARALQVGADCVADELAQRGTKVVAIDEVGIGNMTAAAAALCALLGVDAAECCGRGTGLDDAGLAHKVATVRAACALHAAELAAAGLSPEDEGAAAHAREVLRRLGGLELAAMCSAYVEAARCGVVAVVGWFFSAVGHCHFCGGRWLACAVGWLVKPRAAHTRRLAPGRYLGDRPPRAEADDLAPPDLRAALGRALVRAQEEPVDERGALARPCRISRCRRAPR